MNCPLNTFLENTPYFPEEGAYVVFSIDPMATVKHLNDPRLTSVCASMKNKRYVALVRSELRAIVNAPHRSIRLHLLSYGSPPDVPRLSMSIPVAPSTNPHPLGRKPLLPTLPLPWSNCHHSTLNDVDVRVPT
ncbi:hypothetical protein DFH06DRAFT_984112, partial [Mycena polygramma]